MVISVSVGADPPGVIGSPVGLVAAGAQPASAIVIAALKADAIRLADGER
jgi:hypothetical protein